MKSKLIFLILLLASIASCNQSSKEVVASNTNFIEPPIKNADVPFEEFSVDAERGDTLFYKTGSILVFPPSAFVDKDGNEIKGNVSIRYREFASPIDFFLSGIPMNYDSAGIQYNFVSTGMCEVLAFKKGESVFVNPKNKPEINLVTQSNAQDHSIYFLDTVQKNWINKGASVVTDANKKANNNQTQSTLTYEEITAPIKPEKASGENPTLKINIEKSSIEELKAYNNLVFEVVQGTIEEDDYAREEWSDVQLTSTDKKGLYTVTFKNAKRSVSYLAKPVLEGKDYDKALQEFERKNKEFQQKLARRVEQVKVDKQKYIQDSIKQIAQLEENKRIEKLNVLIEARNKRILKWNEEVEKQNKEVEEWNKKAEKAYEEHAMSTNLMRSFQIDGFGIWNCDQPILKESFEILASFKNALGDTFDLTNLSVLFKSYNGILEGNYNQIKVLKNDYNVIIGVYNGRFAYATTYQYFDAQTPKEQIFTMTVVEEENNNYTYIKSIVDKL